MQQAVDMFAARACDVVRNVTCVWCMLLLCARVRDAPPHARASHALYTWCASTPGKLKMECLVGVKFNDFTILAHDNNAGRSILSMKQDQDKLFKLDKQIGMVVCGEPGDTVYFGEYIQKNIALYRMRNGYSLSPQAAANYTRNQLAEHIRSRHPYLANLLMGGFDLESRKASLYYMDYLGTMVEVPYGAHGYGSHFILGILDKEHRPDMNEREAEELMAKCFREIQKRLIINLPSFSYYVIGTDGISSKKLFEHGISEMDEGAVSA